MSPFEKVDMLLAEWSDFIEAVNSKSTLRPVTMQAWSRCKELGVNPRKLNYVYLTDSELQQRQEANADLIEIARPYMDYISSTLHDIPHVVVLLDKEAWVIAQCGAAEEMGGKAAGFCVGASWDEQNIGNNGGGTALVAGEAVLVYGREHYGEIYHHYADFGVPIKNSAGSIVGAMDVAVPTEYARPSRIAQALASAASIESALAAGNSTGEMPFWLPLQLESQKMLYKNFEDNLKNIAWLLKDGRELNLTPKKDFQLQPYGALSEINECRLILDKVGEDILREVAGDYLHLLETSTAIHEKNGDYALTAFSSGWCRFLDAASRNLCNTNDNREAIRSGQWICRDMCWRTSKLAIESNQVIDLPCPGGLRHYSVAIWAGGQIVGAINLGYGDPPSDPVTLQQIADKYQVPLEELQRLAREYPSRPPFLINVAKKNLHTSAKLIGTIIERKQAEEKLRKLNNDLGKRNLELDNINKELESFCYSVSHDLRAPLRSIDGFSLALLEDYAGKLDEIGKDYLKRVRAASQRMGHLIEDLLNLSRITRYQLHYSEVALSKMAWEICRELHNQQPGRQVEFVIEPDLQTQGDPRLMKIVLKNLLENAWKFTGTCDRAVIEFGATQYNDRTVFFVHDNGAGFDMRYVEKIFSPFQRLHGIEEFPGTGIGLAIVQRIIHRHGGEVWAEGAVNQGATFYFTLY